MATTGLERLLEIEEKLRRGESPNPVSVRSFLAWFGAQRRSYWNVWSIRKALEKAKLLTSPDFESAYVDSEIRFELLDDQEAVSEVDELMKAERSSASEVVTSILPAVAADPTYRISKLAAANNKPLSVNPNASLKEAITLMMANDFSQLPVMTNERDTKGTISWLSIGTRSVLGNSRTFVREAMDVHHEIRADASMFQAIPTIVQHGYVLVRGSDNKITGIVTASDLSLQFQQVAEPFLLLSEIENHVRSLLSGKFSKADLVAVRDPSDSGREIDDVSDLTFGEYLRLLENEQRWEKLGLNLDRKTFCNHLDQVRVIRNDVMHFDPDGVPQSDLEKLRDCAKFLQTLQIIKES
ncbi:CBS domain-containing protein [Bradyrhizobium sp. AZCC 1721]|uniref:CBS domain-containing protein n=1 Tax=Bradyrhizobium sp. AZCC 1721 TaxID=3117016 RepID=UPI002FF25D07